MYRKAGRKRPRFRLVARTRVSLCSGGVNGGRDDAIIFQTTRMLIDPFLSPIRLLEVSHVAHRLSFSQEWVRRLIREKKLAAIRLGGRWRVEPAALQRFIDEQQAAGEPERRRQSTVQALREAAHR